jgi:GTP-binding protein
MQIHSAKFVTSATGLADSPDWEMPEFAWIGRSNVGKSSIINMLCNQRGLAKVSATPGKTRLLNFFLINEKWSLVDLPGYGFAKASRRDKALFNEWVGDYLEQRPHLRRVFVLIDSRHEPQAIDLDFVSWLSSTSVPFTLVFTKSDKLSASKAAANMKLFLEAQEPRTGIMPEALLSSSKTRSGRKEILHKIQHAIDS